MKTTTEEKNQQAKMLERLVQGGPLNPAMNILKEVHTQFWAYGDTSVTIKTLHELLQHWLDTEAKDAKFSNKNHVSNTTFHVLQLSAFLVALLEHHEAMISDKEFEKLLD
jgi:hypothetical protein